MDGTSLHSTAELRETDPSGEFPPSPTKPDAPDALLGTTLAGRYKITSRLGEGGMGVVYAAQHALIGKQVAVKVLHEKYAERPELSARLMNEAKLASSIQHGNIIDVFDVGEIDDGRSFVVMEFLEGESLASLIRREGPLPEARILELGIQIASALGAAHAKGVIHRDVKPENVFLIRRGDADFVKVVDFGISRTFKLDEDGQPITPRLTKTGMVLGTPLYMSPEQGRGQDDLDHRIDVYALGVILYEGLTHEVPFRGTNYLNIISEVLTKEPTPPRQVRPELGISEGIERVVLKAMAKDRTHRYQSMADFAADLERVKEGKTISAPVVAPRRSRRSGAATLAFAVGATLVVGIGGTSWWMARRTHAATPPVAPVAAVAAAAPTASTPPSPPAPTTVTVRINSDPPGATVLAGSRELGTAPREFELARSERPVHLTFKLDGYVDGSYDEIPKVDGDVINIKLDKTPPPKHPRPHRPVAATPPTGDKTPPKETANAYETK